MANNHNLDWVYTQGGSRVVIGGTGYFSGTNGTGSITVVDGLGWSGSLPVGAEDHTNPGAYVLNFNDSYAGLVSAHIHIHQAEVPKYFAQFSCSLSASSNKGFAYLSGTVAKPNSALVFKTYATGSNSPVAMPSGSTPYGFMFTAVLRNRNP